MKIRDFKVLFTKHLQELMPSVQPTVTKMSVAYSFIANNKDHAIMLNISGNKSGVLIVKVRHTFPDGACRACFVELESRPEVEALVDACCSLRVFEHNQTIDEVYDDLITPSLTNLMTQNIFDDSVEQYRHHCFFASVRDVVTVNDRGFVTSVQAHNNEHAFILANISGLQDFIYDPTRRLLAPLTGEQRLRFRNHNDDKFNSETLRKTLDVLCHDFITGNITTDEPAITMLSDLDASPRLVGPHVLLGFTNRFTHFHSDVTVTTRANKSGSHIMITRSRGGQVKLTFTPTQRLRVTLYARVQPSRNRVKVHSDFCLCHVANDELLLNLLLAWTRPKNANSQQRTKVLTHLLGQLKNNVAATHWFDFDDKFDQGEPNIGEPLSCEFLEYLEHDGFGLTTTNSPSSLLLFSVETLIKDENTYSVHNIGLVINTQSRRYAVVLNPDSCRVKPLLIKYATTRPILHPGLRRKLDKCLTQSNPE